MSDNRDPKIASCRPGGDGGIRLTRWVALICLALCAWSLSFARDLTFDERVRAEEALARVRYSHQIGATRLFEEAFPRRVLEDRVRAYLAEGVALRDVWHTPVTAHMLEQELRRITRRSKMPDRLQELFGALDHDAFLVQECIVRPALTDRMARSFFAFDRRIHERPRSEVEALRRGLAEGTIDPRAAHRRGTLLEILRKEIGASHPSASAGPVQMVEVDGEDFEAWKDRLPRTSLEAGPLTEDADTFRIDVPLEQQSDRLLVATFAVPKESWSRWWKRVRPGLDVTAAGPVARDGMQLPDTEAAAAEAASCVDDTWGSGPLDDRPPSARDRHPALWTGSLMIIFGATDGSGGRYDPAIDTWSPTATPDVEVGLGASLAWTGSRVIFWGGLRTQFPTRTYTVRGAEYDPLTDDWRMIPDPPPTVTGRSGHSAVWTGTEMIVWGGYRISGSVTTYLQDGGRYNPVSGMWVYVPGPPFGPPPAARGDHRAVWTGQEMIVWGGVNATGWLNTGGRYDPAAGGWLPTSMVDAPSLRQGHSFVWANDLLIIWGGSTGQAYTNTGRRYDPRKDVWTPTTPNGAPTARSGFSAVSTGHDMIGWGGYDTYYTNTGFRYDPAANAWSPISGAGAPAARHSHSAIWADGQMIVWGGNGIGQPVLDTGGRYDLATDSWTPTSMGTTPSPRSAHTTVWTGDKMIVWGGTASPSSQATASGGQYDPALDSWMPTSPLNAPVSRALHTAVWTGRHMIVWGGSGFGAENSGGLYDPDLDTWTATPIDNAPSPRSSHTAVWTGSQMIVWGGNAGSLALGSGGRYSPTSNAWTSLTSADAPSARFDHTAIWTGKHMVVWGGRTESSAGVGTGGQYDPVTDRWSPTSLLDAPTPRSGHVGVWNGREILVWGGVDGQPGGGRYDPSTDQWAPISLTGAPAPRSELQAVWTGTEMIVWGGNSDPFTFPSAPGRYDPSTDSWSTGSALDAPAGRIRHSQVWTGKRMLVWGGRDNSVTLRSAGAYSACFDSCVPQQFYQDGDADGAGVSSVNVWACTQPPDYVPTFGDCDDTNGEAWNVPGEARDLQLVDEMSVGWTPPFVWGASMLTFDLIRTSVAADFLDSAVCVAVESPDTSTTDAAIPAAGEAFFYLARARNRCPGGTGILGASSGGQPTQGRPCP
jgi:hypothetical protein